MNLCTCPAAQQLRDYVEGRLDPAGHEAVEGHLDQCAECLRAVETLDERGPAPFPYLGGGPGTPPGFDSPDFRRLVARAKALSGPEGSAALSEAALAAALEQRGYRLLGPLGAGGMGRVY